MTGRVEGKVAFITGAARGQGRSHAVRLAQEGADIIAVDLCAPIESVPYPLATREDLAETADLVKSHNRRVVTAEVDVRDSAGLKAAVDSGVEQLGKLNIVIANAGIGNGGESFDQVSEDDWQTMIDINMTGVWKTVKAAAPHLIASGPGGSVILTSSMAGMKAYPMMMQYVAAKHGVVGIMRSLAVELAQHMIRVNSVHPSHVATPMVLNEATLSLFRPDLEHPGPDDIAPICQMFHTMPKPWVEAEDITNAVLFFASDESRYVTGVQMPIDLGSNLK
ncbi:mycofactocin-coupled SDR family oxidoreductase [Mycolicibacterium iranicum]|jgi:(+)-trans-carveol dehydrogenase|uniref:3-ketoacyl-ACP reductase n=1 Tax=Mycolicibacterium iranicum TaxID=912594 RepID=A0A1X1X2P7_MYCIR|nr:mycofactocin-coupled SDR family oxidoreductase [Mycolicibacterium iranicum]ORV93144.1 3-ketoacyl-ACP reductase [Mycolicibacterium iranicum]